MSSPGSGVLRHILARSRWVSVSFLPRASHNRARNATGFPCGGPRNDVTIATGDSVTLEYTGRLDGETVFDTSREAVAEEAGLAEAQPDREYAPLTVDVGAEQVIEGMEEGLVGLDSCSKLCMTCVCRGRKFGLSYYLTWRAGSYKH